ncbi:phBC6A51 family helix-turn-helix protein [Bacillus cereus]|nr:phBC6A51 family helix-turn-helix protein [Bacillus cereus]
MLNKKQMKAIELLYQGELTRAEIAEILKVSDRTIYNWIKDPDFIEEYNKRIKIEYSLMVGRASRKMSKLLNAKSEHVQFLSAKNILDRSQLIEQESEIEYEEDGLFEALNNNHEGLWDDMEG